VSFDETAAERDARLKRRLLGRARRPAMTSQTVGAMRDTINEFLKRIPGVKCANCGAHCPKYKKEGATKMFAMPLTKKKVIANRMNGTPVSNVLETDAEGDRARAEMEAQMAAKLKEQAAKRRKQQQRKDGDGGSGSEEEDGEREEEKAGGKRAKPAAAEDSEDEEDEDDEPLDPEALEGTPHFVSSAEAEEILRRLWDREWELLSLIYQSDVSAQGPLAAGRPTPPPPRPLDSTASAAAIRRHKEGYRMFFLRCLAVAPNKFRPVSRLGDNVYEHSQNTLLQKILNLSLDVVESTKEGGELDMAKSIRAWLELQLSTNNLMDSNLTEEKNPEISGIKQVLEKKEGLFRKNMMGKRVNFAARSVISPDPYISGGEIGVPPYFAKKLNFPERVTAHNVEEMRRLVINGPHVHPGAVAIEDEYGRLVNLNTRAYDSREKREAAAKTLLSGPRTAPGPHQQLKNPGKIVYRHLRDGDLMLTNRQPTLHKPGMMAHRARVLKGERTIRMHYINCSTFNADFDGDEINLHLPQDQFCRAEGYNIVHADHQYMVPTDGKPIRGLIQDHIFAGTLLTKKDTFLSRRDFMQLVYTAVAPTRPNVTNERPIRIPLPAVLKPEARWTGKQVVSTILAHFTQGLPQMTISAGSKVPVTYFGRESGEGEFNVYKGEHITGVIDKNQVRRRRSSSFFGFFVCVFVSFSIGYRLCDREELKAAAAATRAVPLPPLPFLFRPLFSPILLITYPLYLTFNPFFDPHNSSPSTASSTESKSCTATRLRASSWPRSPASSPSSSSSTASPAAWTTCS
jgi:DNA-directed RNA polymerase I subunit RPA1